MSPKSFKDIKVIKPSNKKIDKAGVIISQGNYSIDSEEYFNAYKTIVERRTLHIYPINTFQATLRKSITNLKLNSKIIIAQRIKRISSIILKLKNKGLKYELSSMDDIGGIRIIAKSKSIEENKSIIELIHEIYKKKKSKNYELIKTRNYIEEPQETGYRSLHLIFKYNSALYPNLQNLKIEFQIRTEIQHCRASAVEIIGVYTKESLKSNQGSSDWLQFFKYVSAGFCYIEGTRIHRDFIHLSPVALVDEIKKMYNMLKVKDIIKGLNIATKIIDIQTKKVKKNDNTFFLIRLDLSEKKVYVNGFDDEKLAIDFHNEKENEYLHNKDQMLVLVGLKSIKTLKIAYSSYFLDNNLFLEYLEKLFDTYTQ